MNKVINIILLFACIGVIILGKMHWEDKISSFQTDAGMSEKVEAEEIVNKEGSRDQVSPEVNYSAANLPEEIVEKLKDGDLPITMEAVGSSSTSKDATGWPALLQKRMDNTYGEGVFEIRVTPFGDKTSDQVVQEIQPTDVDILLLEPFLLKNNGVLRIEDSLDLTTIIIKKYKDVNEGVKIMLQPSNPLYNAIHYPRQVEELQKYSAEHNYIYLDHWKAWPALDDTTINDYLTKESEPNEKGHAIWAEYLASYFSAN